jgi:hypothetical protein
MAITMRLFPPDVESTGQFSGILYGPRDPGESAPEFELEVAPAAQKRLHR